MKSHRLNYILVGGFTLAILAGIMLAVALLTGRTGAVDRYHTVYTHVGGIKYGTQVLYEGYRIGQVETIEPIVHSGRTRFKVHFSVMQGWHIPQSSVIQVAASGLLAAITLNIHDTSEDTESNKSEATPDGNTTHTIAAFAPDSFIPGEEKSDIFSMISSVGDEMTDLAEGDVKPLLKRLSKLVDGVNALVENDGEKLLGNVTAVSGALAGEAPDIAKNLSTFSKQLLVITERLEHIMRKENTTRVDSIIHHAEKTSSNIADLTTEMLTTRERIDEALSHVQTAAKSLDRIISGNEENADKAVRDLRHVLETAAHHIDAVGLHMENTTRNMDEFTRRIRQNPSLLLNSSAPGEE
ncbi:MAG: MCE family protein [Magnetococcales bacterium]|nr:MCE family protein [Magnetococcales bacterium]